jgi:toxin ParE1/3/4
MSRYVINVLASQDLNEIADYFAENNIEAGERFFQAFNRKCQQLVVFPNSGKSYESIRSGLRGLSFEKYIFRTAEYFRLCRNGADSGCPEQATGS